MRSPLNVASSSYTHPAIASPMSVHLQSSPLTRSTSGQHTSTSDQTGIQSVSLFPLCVRYKREAYGEDNDSYKFGPFVPFMHPLPLMYYHVSKFTKSYIRQMAWRRWMPDLFLFIDYLKWKSISIVAQKHKLSYKTNLAWRPRWMPGRLKSC